MNQVICPEDVTAVIKSFIDCNSGDASTEMLIINIGCELLDISQDRMLELLKL